MSFESILDLEAFTLRIPEKDAERLPEVGLLLACGGGRAGSVATLPLARCCCPQVLLAVPEEQRQQMQRALARVWHRFAYGSYRPYARRWRELQQQHAAARRAAAAAAPPASLPAAVPDAAPEVDDAFLTIMQWLHARI